jgi:hypothetical protein
LLSERKSAAVARPLPPLALTPASIRDSFASIRRHILESQVQPLRSARPLNLTFQDDRL